MRLLVDAGANVNARGVVSRKTPLHLAVNTNNYEIACYLLEQGADPLLENKCGSTVADIIGMFGDRGVGVHEYDWYVKFRGKIGAR